MYYDETAWIEINVRGLSQTTKKEIIIIDNWQQEKKTSATRKEECIYSRDPLNPIHHFGIITPSK